MPECMQCARAKSIVDMSMLYSEEGIVQTLIELRDSKESIGHCVKSR